MEATPKNIIALSSRLFHGLMLYIDDDGFDDDVADNTLSRKTKTDGIRTHASLLAHIHRLIIMNIIASKKKQCTHDRHTFHAILIFASFSRTRRTSSGISSHGYQRGHIFSHTNNVYYKSIFYKSINPKWEQIV